MFNWVADHRRHHKYSDKEGDPHSPWRYGDDTKALTKGLSYAHMLWLFDHEQTSQEKFVPDLLADRTSPGSSHSCSRLVALSLLAPAADRRPVVDVLARRPDRVLLGQPGPRRAAAPRDLVDQLDLPHVRQRGRSQSGDQVRNVSWLAIASFGESWHNLHHADPTCARHGVLKGQLDPSARVIWVLEKLGWAYDVRWPDARG